MTGIPGHLGPAGDRFAETLDWDSAMIQAHGPPTEQDADLMRGAVEVLRQSGRHRITVDLCGVRSTDDDALAALHSLAHRLRARRFELVDLSEKKAPS
jgi:anti-anti-sigma regulatory factor